MTKQTFLDNKFSPRCSSINLYETFQARPLLKNYLDLVIIHRHVKISYFCTDHFCFSLGPFYL